MAQGDFRLHNYQDDLDNAEDGSTVDEFTMQKNDDLSEDTGMPPDELADEMAKLAVDEPGHDDAADDDVRENLEDQDEDLISK